MSTPARHRVRGPLIVLVVLAGMALSAAIVEDGSAQDYSTVVRVLRDSRDFRARVRAALALGASNDRSNSPHLVRALSDDNAAGRAAAATSLGRLGDPSTLAALRRLNRDREGVVRREAERAIRRIEVSARAETPRRAVVARPARGAAYPTIAVMPEARDIHWPGVRYVVVLGSMEDRSNFHNTNLGARLSQEVSRNLIVLRGVAVLHEGQVSPAAEQQIRRRRLPKLRLEGSVNRVERRNEPRQVSVRCEVSLLLLEEPGRNIRSVLNGAATGSQPRRGQRASQEAQLAEQALQGAVRSAMSGAARAIASVR